MPAAQPEKARTEAEAQKAIEDLKAGSAEGTVKDFAADLKIEDIVRNREVAQAGKRTGAVDGGPAKGDGFDDVDRGIELGSAAARSSARPSWEPSARSWWR